MKTIILCLMLVGLFGCASMKSRMNGLSPGMTKEQVVEKLGGPDTSGAKNGNEVLSYEDYRVVLQEGKVTAYGHMDELFPPTPEEVELRRIRAQAEIERQRLNQEYWNNYSQQRKPAQIYQPARPVQTNCTTYGNQTNCTSQPTGIDASIYNR